MISIFQKSHPRQWVDVSSPAYSEGASLGYDFYLPKNPTHGSGWMFQVQPTAKDASLPVSISIFQKIPPTAVGGNFRSSLQRKTYSLRYDLYLPKNHTHGSGWMFQGQPTAKDASLRYDFYYPKNPTHGSGWMFQVQPITRYVTVTSSCRLYLNHPPTAVGGIRERTAVFRLVGCT